MDGAPIEAENPRRSTASPARQAGLSAQGAVAPAPIDAQPTRTSLSHDDRLATLLLSRGVVSSGDVAAARHAAAGLPVSLGRILLARDLISEAELLSAEAHLAGTSIADLAALPPDPALAALLPAERAITLECVPWRRMGTGLVLATARPDCVRDAISHLPRRQRVHVVLASRDHVIAAQTALYGAALARAAEGRAPERVSCRTGRPRAQAWAAAVLCAAALLAALLGPQAAVLGLTCAALLVYVANISLKALAFGATLHRGRATRKTQAPAPTVPLRAPLVTILLPLFREAEIATHLVRRIAALDYPPERLDVLFCVESEDRVTARALAATTLPPYMRAITVPEGQPRTKPRALNYALNFAQGDIICIYDAEDRPETDQIHRVAQRFAEVGPEVACLQGRLDYYNSRHNWLAAMFTLEYASWFRVLLPGVQRLGLFVPLGGTTLFLRRAALEAVGGWDAHNVTEDAELGLRLARAGYRTEIVETTTFEEANAAVLPWIGQRSRWFKGYLVTWFAAMRRPFALWRDLGTWRFFGLQAQMIAAVLGFLFAPLLWSLAVKLFGAPHPLDQLLGPAGYRGLMLVFLAGAALTMAIAFHGARAAHLRHLRASVPLIEVYFLLGIAAAWRAVVESVSNPFFWAKTKHGGFGRGTTDASVAVATTRPQASSASSFRRTTKAIDK